MVGPASRPLSDRLWERVDRVEGGCWNWRPPVGSDGYGKISRQPPEPGVRGKMVRANRATWEIAHGAIPEGLQVLHRCDNRRCCNPDHLFLGTNADNMADRNQKGRDARELSHWKGKLTDEQVREIRNLYRPQGVKSKRGGWRSNAVELAQEYGVSRAHISGIASGKLRKRAGNG